MNKSASVGISEASGGRGNSRRASFREEEVERITKSQVRSKSSSVSKESISIGDGKIWQSFVKQLIYSIQFQYIFNEYKHIVWKSLKMSHLKFLNFGIFRQILSY